MSTLASHLNITQQGEVLAVLSRFAVTSAVPLLVLESFIMGVLLACVPLGSYMLWLKLRFARSALPISCLWIFLGGLTIHWALSLRQLEGLLSGSAIRISPTITGLKDPSNTDSSAKYAYSYELYGFLQQFALPFVTETVLFGFSSVLLALAAWVSLKRFRSDWHSGLALLMPTITLLMYTVSLVHWAVSLQLLVQLENNAATLVTQSDWTLRVCLAVLFSTNVVMNDTIVMWRMCVVWNNTRLVLSLATAVILAILGLSIAYLIRLAGSHQALTSADKQNDSESDPIHSLGAVAGLGSIGLASVFMSLVSNLFATVLVGFKAWSHRRQLAEHAWFNNRRTVAERVLQLLAESGVVYTSIGALYCFSFFWKITEYTVAFTDPGVPYLTITAVDHIDAAMAQITSIYPLMVFILLALDKIHYDQAPQFLSQDEVPDIGFTSPEVEVDPKRRESLAVSAELQTDILDRGRNREVEARMVGEGKHECSLSVSK